MSRKKDTIAASDEQYEARKALRKREQKTLERLQEAQQARAKAQARMERAQARRQKRMERVARIEARLLLIQQQLAAPGQTAPTEQFVSELAGDASRPEQSETTGEDWQPVEARAAAEATEQRIRLSAERAIQVAPQTTQASAPDMPVEEPERPAQEEEATSIPIPAELLQIEEEEALLEASSAGTFAQIAAERATKTRVAAELSSEQTREARKQAQQAEQALGRVRLDIRYGVLSGEDADIALRQAEREVTRTQAALADAEAAEEQALQAAINAEAAAEVAEGMASATSDHLELLEYTGESGDVVEDSEITMSMPVTHPPSEELPT
jgi:hypothetical protein